MTSTKKLSRRTVLRGAFGAAIALPLLEAFGGSSAQAANAAPKRFIVMFSPNGTVQNAWTPDGGETDFTLSPILSPLSDHRDDLLIVQGLEQRGANGDAHQIGMSGMLTGAPLGSGPFAGVGAPPAGWALGPSVDQVIAETLSDTGQRRSLELGVQVGNADNWGRMCYRGPNQPLPPESDPMAVYTRVFSDLHTDPELLARMRARQSSILDGVSAQYARMASQVSVADRARLDAHLTSVRELEQRLTSTAPARGPSCADPQVSPLAHEENDSYPAVGALQIDLLVMAIVCDLTRVASLQWSRSVSQTRFTWLQIGEGHHDLSHRGDDELDAQEALVRINTWYAAQFATLISKLKEHQDVDGKPLLYSSLLLWCNELGTGNIHSRKNAPYVLAGSAGGSVRPGRLLRFTGDRAHNDLLIAICNAMGASVETFGNPEWCSGALPGLV